MKSMFNDVEHKFRTSEHRFLLGVNTFLYRSTTNFIHDKVKPMNVGLDA